MFKSRRTIPEPPPLAEPEPSTLADEIMADIADRAEVSAAAEAELAAAAEIKPVAGLETLADAVAATEPAPAPEPVLAPTEPIAGLDVGRIVHVMGNQKRAAIVAEVHDVRTGDCTVYVFEPVAPPRSERRTYAGNGAAPGPDTWAWPARS